MFSSSLNPIRRPARSAIAKAAGVALIIALLVAGFCALQAKTNDQGRQLRANTHELTAMRQDQQTQVALRTGFAGVMQGAHGDGFWTAGVTKQFSVAEQKSLELLFPAYHPEVSVQLLDPRDTLVSVTVSLRSRSGRRFTISEDVFNPAASTPGNTQELTCSNGSAHAPGDCYALNGGNTVSYW